MNNLKPFWVKHYILRRTAAALFLLTSPLLFPLTSPLLFPLLSVWECREDWKSSYRLLWNYLK